MSTGLIGEIITLLGIPQDSYFMPIVIVCSFICIFELLFMFLKILFNIFGIGGYK